MSRLRATIWTTHRAHRRWILDHTVIILVNEPGILLSQTLSALTIQTGETWMVKRHRDEHKSGSNICNTTMKLWMFLLWRIKRPCGVRSTAWIHFYRRCCVDFAVLLSSFSKIPAVSKTETWIFRSAFLQFFIYVSHYNSKLRNLN
jgi:hypothetical protein